MAACSYELGALASGRYPTLSVLCARHRVLGPVLVGALAVHLWRQPRYRAHDLT